jgi:acyl-CoA synthetase (AMP-forming)/AMP-acid ligase II
VGGRHRLTAAVDTLGELLSASLRRWSSRVAVVQSERSLTYGALSERAGRLAHALERQGVRSNDRVAAFVDDRPETVEVIVGCALGGFTLVPVNGRFRAGEATHVVHDAGAVALVYSASLGEAAAGIEGLGDLRVVIAVGGAEAVPGAVDYETLLASHPPRRLAAAVAPDDVAVIGYTSGTTGFPKGARCSHRSVVTATRLVPYVQGMQTNGSGAFTGSFSFVSALWGILFPHLWTGATLRLTDPSPVGDWIDRMALDRATYTWVPSPLVPSFTAEIGQRPEVLGHLRTVVHTGSKVPREFLASLVDVVGDRLVETWGLTETVGPLTATTRADLAGHCLADDVLSSVGRPVPTAEVGVLGPSGEVRSTADAGPGELVARGDTLFSGYLGGAEGDPDVFTADGWFRTGDVGRVDDAGYVYIEDRCKDMICSGGMNVYAAEVELAILTLPGVAECAVYGVPDERWGEAVAAAVVVVPGWQLDERTVVSHVRSRLAGYKKPTVVRFLDALPRNASMKVQKHLLRAPG